MAPDTHMDHHNMTDESGFDRHRRKTRRRVAIIAVSAVALVALVAVIAVSSAHGKKSSKASDAGSTGENSMPASIKAVCDAAVYPDSCYATLSKAMNGSSFDVYKLYRASLQVAVAEVSRATAFFEQLKDDGGGRLSEWDMEAVDYCETLLHMTYDVLNASSMAADLSSPAVVDDFKTWLSAALSYENTCVDGFSNSSVDLRNKIASYVQKSTEFSSNSLAVLTQISNFLGQIKLRKLLTSDGFPTWMPAKDRKLLQSPDLRASATIVVAKDGTGKFTTISAALAAVPSGGAGRTVIYVKKGVYEENVRVTVSSVVMVGDGMDATVVTGSRSVAGGVNTFQTATFGVMRGSHFMAIDMAFVNTAGPEGEQAVALMVNSDFSVFYRCRMDAYQDTLLTQALRQFYRECDILGTVDFIFGDAPAVFQGCNILPRARPGKDKDTITAQGRSDPNENTGLSFHSCAISPSGSIGSTPVFLGRPWKDYARTVFMKCTYAVTIAPAGWLAWNGKVPGGVYYGEFANTGPGASTAGRVAWKGVHSAMSPAEAAGFTVGAFIGGGSWLPGTGVPFTADL